MARHGVQRDRAPVTPADRAAYRRNVVTATDPGRRAIEERLVEEMPFPNEQPAYRQFLVADDGDLWLESYTADAGVPVEWVRVPTARSGTPSAIAGRAVSGHWRSEGSGPLACGGMPMI